MDNHLPISTTIMAKNETGQAEAINRIKKAVHIWKFTTAQQAKQSNTDDKQKYILPNIPFRALTLGYENSFLLPGIVEKISSGACTGFVKTGNNEVDNVVDAIDHALAFQNLYIYGNFFQEIVPLVGGGKIFEPFITQTVKIKRTQDKRGRIINSTYIQEVAGSSNGIEFENNKEIYHYKGSSLTNKFYGDAKWSKCITQICLLEIIDQFYEQYFNNGLISPFLLGVKSGSLSEKEIETINQMIKDGMRGKENAFAGMVLPVEMTKLDLNNEFKTKDFIDYRTELIKSIAISLNIPYGMLINDSSNRATAEAERQTFNTDIIAPLQKYYVRQLKDMLIIAGYPAEAVNKIEFNVVDTRNQKELMETATGYYKSKMLTLDEAREFAGWKKYGGEDGANFFSGPDFGNSQQQQDIQQQVAKLYQSKGK